jgi:hypothetical protein
LPTRFTPLTLFILARFRSLVFQLSFILLWIGFTPANAQVDDDTLHVDLVFCLDLSASTNGLIEHIREHLWDYTYLFDQCTPKPQYRIGFVAFSRPSFKKENQYVKVVNDLTTDLDLISNNMFDLIPEVEKGDQYVGAALQTCLRNISWTKHTNSLKIVFIAGNGMINLGEADALAAAAKLVQSNISVFPIYCANRTIPQELRSWNELAVASNQTLQTLSLNNHYYERVNPLLIDKLRKLNKKLNATYLYYDNDGKARWKILDKEDFNIFLENAEGLRYRSIFKLSPYYADVHYNWDLVDLSLQKKIDWNRFDHKQFSDTMKFMDDNELNAYLIFKKYERKKYQTLISKLLEEIELDAEKNFPQRDKLMRTFDTITIQILEDQLKIRDIALKRSLIHAVLPNKP